ncbi:AAA family ATPase [Anaerococcus kampingiae]|uniref:Nuclease SbcCD subunit C n=1 Tax=Anaerococcus kampingae TaxID=3115614 RepID=A0ABW9MD61_9FIRM
MKAKRLKMRGFLTYKNEIEIDFTKFFDKKIFLISGPTGSGKTTIFDAISFALYGSIPREISQENMRSDYLKEDDPDTFVEFEFEIGSKTYLIERYPNQRSMGARGPRNLGHKAILFDISDEKKLLADKPRDVEPMVKEIVGLDVDQFSKVMLLAQGKFQEFLSAKSDVKAALLSDIFKTKKYRDITDKLKEKAKISKNKINEIDDKLSNIISYDEILKEVINGDYILALDFKIILKIIGDNEKDLSSQLSELQKDEDSLDKNIKDSYRNLEKSKNTNENISSYQKSQAAYNLLYKNFEEKSKEKSDLDLASFAKSIKIYEERIEKTQDSIENLTKNLEADKNLLEEKNAEAKNLEKDLAKIDDLAKNLDKNKLGLAEKEKTYQALGEFLSNKKAYESIKTIEKEKQDLEEKIKNIDENLENLRKTYGQAREDKAKLKEEGLELKEKLRAREDKLLSLKKDQARLLENKAYEKDIESLSKERENYLNLKDKASLDREIDQLNYFIERLNHDGICPVCGTRHEEKFPLHKSEGLDFDKIVEKLNDLNLSFEKIRLLIDKNIKDLEMDDSLENIRGLIKDNEDLIKSYGDLLGKNQKEIDLKDKLLQKTEEEGKILGLEKEKLAQALKEINVKLDRLQELKIAYLGQKEKMEGLKEEALLAEIKSFEKNIKEASDFIERTKSHDQEIKLALSSLKAEIGSFEKTLSENKENLTAYQKEFEDKVAEKFENQEDYRSYLDKFNDLDLIKIENQEYFKNLDRLKANLDNLKDFKDLDLIDLEIFKEKITDLEEKAKSLADRKLSLNQGLSSFKRAGLEIRAISQEFEKEKNKSLSLTRLADLASGTSGANKGREKIDFETYILSVYFDRVLNFANKRFNKMTEGQFTMLRKKEATDNRSKAGLDIEILDANTGKRRPATSLSGGESFLASLSLALGLSDEIGAENGGIRIDTLFIDEGFGTLSKEFLDNAIRAIEEISKDDRFVGLISHVDELKDAIDAKILISYEPSDGSKIEVKA